MKGIKMQAILPRESLDDFQKNKNFKCYPTKTTSDKSKDGTVIEIDLKKFTVQDIFGEFIIKKKKWWQRLFSI